LRSDARKLKVEFLIREKSKVNPKHPKMSTPATPGSSKRKRPIISSSDDEDVTPQIVDVERVASTSSQRKETEQEVQSQKEPPTAKKRRRISKRNVLLWSHFEQTKDPDVVICKSNPSCQAKIRRPDGSTSGMLAHFEARHPMQYMEYLAKSKKAIEEKVCIYAVFLKILPGAMDFQMSSIFFQHFSKVFEFTFESFRFNLKKDFSFSIFQYVFNNFRKLSNLHSNFFDFVSKIHRFHSVQQACFSAFHRLL